MIDETADEAAERMERRWTPSPWHVVPYGDGDSLVICSDEQGDWRIAFLATHGGSASSWRKIQADARLIAAAPELYEALAEARLQIEYLHDKFQATGSGESVLAKIDATLKKARGE